LLPFHFIQYNLSERQPVRDVDHPGPSGMGNDKFRYQKNV